MFRYLFIALIFSQLVEAGGLELDSLLSQYNEEIAPFKQTKKDAGGEFTVFTREDLDRMHIRQLSDILNLLKYFNLTTSSFGENQLGLSSASSSEITSLKLFINSHEISNVTFGNPILEYGSMNLDFIDYIEIYQSGNSISFGSESATVIVRLFTKKPTRENGEFIKVELDNRASFLANILAAHPLEDKRYSYLMNLNLQNKNAKVYHANAYDFKNDKAKGTLFFQFQKKDDYSIEVSATKVVKDGFANPSQQLLYSSKQGSMSYLQINKKFPSNMTLHLSTTYETVTQHSSDAVGTQLSNQTVVKNIHNTIHTTNVKAILEKNIESENNHLFLAGKFQRSTFSVDEFIADGNSINMLLGPDRRNVFALYGEDTYRYNKHNVFVAGVKYHAEADSDTLSEARSHMLYRLGHIAYIDSFTNKLFVFNRDIDPSFSQETYSPVQVKPNPYLLDTEMFFLSDDFTYKLQKETTIKAGISLGRLKNLVVVNTLLHQYVNNPQILTLKRSYVGLEHKFDLDTKLKLEIYKVFLENTNYSPSGGGYLQFFSKLGKLDIYNELVYRSSYTNEVKQTFGAGYDYSLTLAYPVNKKLNIVFKGQNIFDKASESSIYELNNLGQVTSSFSVPSREQRLFLSLEYIF